MIINRALIREILQTSGAVTLVMLSIFMVVRLVGFLRQAADGEIPVDSVLTLLSLKLLTYMDVILPLMLYVAILMVFGRWNRDNEMAVISACGIGLKQFLKPMTKLFLLSALIVGAFSLYISPMSVRVSEQIEHEYRHRNEISGVVPGVFAETRGGRGVYFVETYNEQIDQYQNLFAYNSSFNREGVVIATTGYQSIDESTNNQFLILKNGTRYEGNPGSPDYRVVDFETYAVRLKQRVKRLPEIPVKGFPTAALMNSSEPILVTEWHWRLSKLLSMPALILLALAFSSVDGRRSRLPNMLMAFVVYFAYTNVLGLVVAMMRRGDWNPHYGLWVIHFGFLLFAWYLFARRSNNKPLIPRFRKRKRLRLVNAHT